MRNEVLPQISCNMYFSSVALISSRRLRFVPWMKREKGAGGQKKGGPTGDDTIYERAFVKRGRCRFCVVGSSTAPLPSASVELAHIGPAR